MTGCGGTSWDSRDDPLATALGYGKGTNTGEVPYVPSSAGITGHEFHYTRLDPDADTRQAICLWGKGILAGKDGLISSNALGCYTHSPIHISLHPF